MFKKKRKKVTKMRGSHTHGGGAKKKGRGAGNRGGRGLSGTGKKGDQKKSRIIKEFGLRYFGKRGFASIYKKEINYINLSYISSNLDKLVEKGVVSKEKEGYVLDLSKTKYDKVLGSGSITKKIKVIGDVTKKAKEKIEKAGGIVED